MDTLVAQLSGRTTTPAVGPQSTGGVIPKPHSVGQAVGYVLIGVLVLVAVLGLAIKLMSMMRAD